ncbi:MAG: hypothetical protein GQ574_06015 [Crocinitomix sp.]|nr:hypothetical protein [Crocinitomix sp.]
MTSNISKHLKAVLKLELVPYLFIAILLNSCAGEMSAESDTNSGAIDLQKELDVEVNQFNIAQNSDTILFGEAGTAIFIEANSFESFDGKELVQVDFSLKEYYDMSDMLIQDLSTQTENGVLETGGMIHVEATSNGKKVYLKAGKDLIIHFPKNGNTAEMQLFSQSFTDSPTNTVKWKKEKPSVGHEVDTLTPFIIKYEDLDNDTMETIDGKNIWDWLEDEIILTEKERDYVRLRDFNIKFIVTKNGEITNVELEKGYDERRCKRLLNLIKNMPNVRPYRRNGALIDMESWVNFAVKYIPAKHLSNAAYLKEIEGKYPDFGNNSINDIDQVELNYYIFNTAKLGWLNCDHFVDDPSPKVDMSLILEEPENLMIKFVYKDLKSIITPSYADGISHFRGVPEGKDITLIIIKTMKKKIQMSITEHITSQGELKGVSFKDYTMEELKNELVKLD